MAHKEKKEILDEVTRVLQEMFQFSADDLAPEKHLVDDLDLDSLDAIDMAQELTRRTNIRFTNDDIRQIRTVEDIVQTILKKRCELS